MKSYTALPEASLELDIDGQGGGRLIVNGPLVAGGTLLVKFVKGYRPGGRSDPVDAGGPLAAHFSRIVVEGYQARPVSSATRLGIKLL
ncbi:hypothetical protein WDV93_23115 [Pantoea ananatis]